MALPGHLVPCGSNLLHQGTVAGNARKGSWIVLIQKMQGCQGCLPWLGWLACCAWPWLGLAWACFVCLGLALGSLGDPRGPIAPRLLGHLKNSQTLPVLYDFESSSSASFFAFFIARSLRVVPPICSQHSKTNVNCVLPTAQQDCHNKGNRGVGPKALLA